MSEWINKINQWKDEEIDEWRMKWMVTWMKNEMNGNMNEKMSSWIIKYLRVNEHKRMI